MPNLTAEEIATRCNKALERASLAPDINNTIPSLLYCLALLELWRFRHDHGLLTVTDPVLPAAPLASGGADTEAQPSLMRRILNGLTGADEA
jgi:hypothetical protein